MTNSIRIYRVKFILYISVTVHINFHGSKMKSEVIILVYAAATCVINLIHTL